MKKKFENGFTGLISKAKGYIDNKDKVIDLVKEAADKAKDKKGYLSEVWDNLQLFFQVIQVWVKGEYKEIPKKTIVTIVAALLYFVIPTDSIPDFILGFGLVDDAAVIGFAVKQILSDLEKFKLWKESQGDYKLDK